jgi:hypothetical protein
MSTRARIAASLIATLAVAVALSASAQQVKPPQIGINVDRDPIVRGEAFELTITIASEGRGDPEVQLPNFTGLRVLRQSESHPMSFSFSFGFGKQSQKQTKQQSIYNFVLVADRAGKYVIDPVVVKIGGQQFKSDPYSLTVADHGGSPSSGPALQPSPSQPGSPLPEPSPPAPEPTAPEPVNLDGAKLDQDHFIQMSATKERATVGEMIVLTVYVYTSWRISDIEITREPGTEGFWVETLLAGQRRLAFEKVTVDGKNYERAVLRKLALFPIKPGTITVAPTVADLEVKPGGFFSRRKTVKRTSAPLSIEVVPLPSEDQPPGFEPSNVGRFNFSATIDRNKVEVGEPITLTMTARGEGNLRNLALPKIEQVEGFKVYEPESEVDLRAAGRTVTGLRASRVLMIPKQAGNFEVPAISWSYFDPSAGQYRTSTSPARKVEVRPSSNGFAGDTAAAASSAGPDNGSFDRLNRKLRSILSRTELSTDGDRPTMAQPWFLVLVLLAPLCYLGVVLASRARQRMAEGRIKGRSKRAGALAKRRLAELRKTKDDLAPTRLYAELERVLTRFLEDRLETAVAGDTTAELRARLVARGFSGDQAAQVVTEIEACDFARFARSAGGTEERRQGLRRIEALITALQAVPVTPPPEEEK